MNLFFASHTVVHSALPIGTAFGYIISSVVASELGWQFAFLIEALVVSPIVFFLWFVSPRFPFVPPGVSHFQRQTGDDDGTDRSSSWKQEPLLAEEALRTDASGSAPVLTYWEKIFALRKHYCYICIILGYAALNAVLIGIATFGSSFLMAVGYFNDEVESSSTLGAIISVAGLAGFPLGGLAVDYLKKKDATKKSENRELFWACVIMLCTAILGTICFCLLYFVDPKIGYMVLLSFGLLFLFVFNSAITLSILYSLPIDLQSIGIACAMIVSHVLGDVPSPLIVGYLKDTLASGCTGDDDEVSTSTECRDDENGIRLTMLLTSLWLFWCILFSGLALYLSKTAVSQNKQI